MGYTLQVNILFLLYFLVIYYLYIYISSQLIQQTFMLTGDEKLWTGNIHSIEKFAISFPSKYVLYITLAITRKLKANIGFSYENQL